MKNSAINEYAYSSSAAVHHHQYLAKPVLHLITPFAHSSDSTLSITNRPKLLDLGCGNGSFSNFLAKQGFEVTGIEESTSGIAQAQQAYPDCCFKQGSIYDLDVTELSQTFDVVLAAEVIEHLVFPRELVRLARQCLRPGGILILTTPYHGYLKNLTLALMGKMDGHFTALWDGGHIKFFSVNTLQKLLVSEGFADPQFQFAGRVPYLWKSMVCAARLTSLN